MGQQGRRGPRLLGDKADVKLLAFTMPIVVITAIKAAAKANYESPSAFCRRVIVERLRADGVIPPVRVDMEASGNGEPRREGTPD